MGYRIYLGRIAKSEHTKYIGKTEEQLDEEFSRGNGYFDWVQPPGYEKLLCLGKHVDYPEGRNDFYSHEHSDYLFEIMTKEGLAAIIEDYRKNTQEYYAELQRPENRDKLANSLHFKEEEWSGKFGLLPYYLDQAPEECDGAIVSSWKIEYQIFNLIYIYRTFDWENDFLIYSGH